MSMNIRLLLVIIYSFSLLLLHAENYPYRNDVLWVTVPDSKNWIYETGENAKIEVQLYKYGIPQDGVTVKYKVGSELMPLEKEDSVVLKNGSAVVNIGTMMTPGFRDCKFSVELEGDVSEHHIKVGFSPEKILPYTNKPLDFDSFWRDNINKSEKFPLKYIKTLVDEFCTDRIDCYLIKLFLNNNGQAIYGYLFYPKNAKKNSCPVVLSPPGAGIKTIKNPLKYKYYPENGFIRFEFEIHGLNPQMSDTEFAEINAAFNSNGNGYLTNNIDNRDNYYMKRVYLACKRCVDFLTSLPEWDGKNVIVHGGSQGGALSLITAGLDSRINICAAKYPALTDMAGYNAGRAGGYPHFFRMNGMNTPEKLKTMAYYDVVNFASNIKAETFLTWGFNDNTCPPTTSYAVYNILKCPKEALITPINEHWSSDKTEYKIMRWIKNKLK